MSTSVNSMVGRSSNNSIVFLRKEILEILQMTHNKSITIKICHFNKMINSSLKMLSSGKNESSSSHKFKSKFTTNELIAAFKTIISSKMTAFSKLPTSLAISMVLTISLLINNLPRKCKITSVLVHRKIEFTVTV
jgi:hypothetical protein